MKSHLFLFLFIIGLGPHSLFSQTGSLDPDFGGGDGLVTTVLYDNRPSEGNAIAVQSDGKILVAGYTGTADDKYYGCLLRYNADGSLDNSFNGTGKILIYTGYKNSSTEGVLIQPDKKILTTVLGNDSLRTQLFLYRFNPDGSPDLTFSGDGVTQDSLGARYLSAHAIAR